MKEAEDPIGKDNDKHLLETAKKSKTVILAWGNHGSFMNRNKEVLKLLSDIPMHCLEITKKEHPKHPLTVRSDIRPIDFAFHLSQGKV